LHGARARAFHVGRDQRTKRTKTRCHSPLFA
jgi:hypothetical protein